MKKQLTLCLALLAPVVMADQQVLPENAADLPKVTLSAFNLDFEQLAHIARIQVNGTEYASLSKDTLVLKKGVLLFSTDGLSAYKLSGDLVVTVENGFDTSSTNITDDVRLKSIQGNQLIFSVDDNDSDLALLQKSLLEVAGVVSVAIDVHRLGERPF